MKKPIQLLDVTLRDGSYAIDFSFTAEDTTQICKGLEMAGVSLVEIGHGVGLGASGERYGQAVATDEEYMQAACAGLTKAKWGMFCIPGIATLEHLDLAKHYGMHFVRIGTNVTEVEKSEAFIKKAKEAGMLVAANYMKSYAVSPEVFAQKVLLSQQYGVDIAYIVDSAGSMFPDGVAAYYKAVRAVSDIPLGFHGHENLGLAVANSLMAADLGIEYIDASLQGLGRSAGNACSEELLAVLIRRGYELPIDLFALLEVGQKLVRPRLRDIGRAPLDVISGFAEFHSSYMPHIQECAAKYGVDAGQLIIEITKVDKVNLDPAVLEEIAKRLPKANEAYFKKYGFTEYPGKEQDA